MARMGFVSEKLNSEPQAIAPRIVNQLFVEIARVPLIQHHADVENDSAGRARAHPVQPWRALKRRFVLLMT